MFLFLVFLIAAIAGFGTGLLGIGGGLIIFPSFLYILPALGHEALSINYITGIAALQIFTGSLFAFLAHKGSSLIERKTLLFIGISGAIGSLIGSVGSIYMPEKLLLLIYLGLLAVSFLTMTVFKPKELTESNNGSSNSIVVNILCFGTGIIAGALGLGGAVLYIPILRHFHKLSTKLCIGNVTFIVFCGSIMTFTGKALTNQIPYELAFIVLLGAFAGAKLGVVASKNTSSKALKKILLMIILLTAIRVSISLLS